MTATKKTFVLAAAENCSAAASTTTIGALAPDIGVGWDLVEVEAQLLGPTGGTLDVVIQDSDDGAVWRDWCKFTQVAAVTASKQHACAGLTNAITTIGIGSLATPAVAISAGTVRPGMPGPIFRAIYITGAGVSAAAAQTISIKATRTGR